VAFQKMKRLMEEGCLARWIRPKDSVTTGLVQMIGCDNPLNSMINDPESMDSTRGHENEVYCVASELSALKESIPIQAMGYCPICHIAMLTLATANTLSQMRARIAEVWMD